jgi:exonuclease SbcC
LHSREAQIKTLIEQNKQTLEKLAERGTPTQDQDTLQLALGDLLSTVAGLNQKLGSLTSELEADALRKKQYAEKLAEKEEQQQTVSRWKQLTDLIGSADGNKFRMFAQGLTLQQLATLANRHLRHFSPRYSIGKMPGDNLELEIHDAWQAGVARPISTLSGGETFLVSLSLALGLSDLASKKVQIGSLFIDEGFGTLDADTLDTAIDALENLQMQGKTIGIISHVGALKERMSTQVQVRKRSGGYSTVEVNGVSAEV